MQLFPFPLDYHNGVKEGVISKMKNEERKVNPNCIKASNPYHECGERCFKRNGEANALGFKKQSGVLFFVLLFYFFPDFGERQAYDGVGFKSVRILMV